MAGAVDSKAVFQQRVKVVGLEAFYDKFVENDFTTMAEFAFVANFTPGATDDARFLEEAKKILGPDLPKINAFRRLHFESYTLFQADMRRQIEKVDDDKPRSLSLPERNVRRQTIAPQLEGLDVQGVHNVSDSLVDKAAHMKDTKVLKWLAWEDCTTKQEENNGVKSLPTWKADASGVVRESPGETTATTKTNTDYHLHNLLIRRGIALAQGGVVTFKNHQRLTRRFMSDLASDPPPGYQRVTYTQVRQADQKFWELMSLEVQDGIEDVDSGRTNVDEAFERVLSDVRFTLLLAPRQEAVQKRQRGDRPSDDDDARPRKQNRKGEQNKKGDKGSGKGGKKGNKGKGSQKQARAKRMPQELVGCVSEINEEPICYGFNMRSGCALAQAGQWCQRGWHLCCLPGCGGDHPKWHHDIRPQA